MGKLIAIVAAYLFGVVKNVSTFFLSGGGVVFLAASLFVGFVGGLTSLISDYQDVVVGYVDQLVSLVAGLHRFDADDTTKLLVYAVAGDSFISDLTAFCSVFFSTLFFVVFGFVSSLLSILVPLALFKVGYFLKSKLVSSFS